MSFRREDLIDADWLVMDTLGWRYYRGPKGVAVWTAKADLQGVYWLWFFRPAGVGVRSGGRVKTFKRVTRKDAKRKSKQSVINRAYELAYGKPRYIVEPTPKTREKFIATGNVGFCMKEKKRVIIEEWEETTAKNGRALLRGQCPSCGTNVQKYGKLIDCPECGKLREGSAGDYICKVCRAAA